MAVLLLVIAWQGKTSSGGYATYRPWQKWIRTPLYNRHGDVRSHVSSLVKSVEDLTQSGKNTMISDVQNVELPKNPVRDTPFEQLMVATLLDDGPGVVAAYAESGSGKSTAATLAIVEAAKYSTSDFFVLLENELDYNLEEFFCLSQVSSTATIATAFFQALKKKGIRLHLVFDNVLDSGANDYIVKDRLKALARAACDCGHQLLFTMQEQAAAESVASLDGVTTRMARVQNSTFGAYRWNQNEAEQLITDIKATFEATPQIEMNMTKALTESKIPDELGQWTPRTINLFMQSGVVPKRRMRAGLAPVWVQHLRKDDGGRLEFVGNAFPVKEKDLQDIYDLKKAIEETKLSAAAPLIDIYSQQEDDSWKKEGKLSASLRNNDEDSPYGFFLS